MVILRPSVIDTFSKPFVIYLCYFLAEKYPSFSFVFWILLLYSSFTLLVIILEWILKKPKFYRYGNNLINETVFSKKVFPIDGLEIRSIKSFFMYYIILKNKGRPYNLSSLEFKKQDLLKLKEYIEGFNAK